MEMNERTVIKVTTAPPAIGPYSQGIKVNNFIFLSGQIPVDTNSGQVVGTDVATQTEQVLRNITAILEAVGGGLFQVVKSTVFLKNMEDFAAMNQVYEKHFNFEPPARSTVEVSRLPKDVLVEIECIAALPQREPTPTKTF